MCYREQERFPCCGHSTEAQLYQVLGMFPWKGWGRWAGDRTSAVCVTDCGMYLQGKMVNQLTGDWRRPWIASRGSLHQPAWPVQLSETHAHPPAIPEGKGTAGPPGLARTGDPAAHHSITPPAGSSPRPHTALWSTASLSPATAPRVPPPHLWAGARCTSHPLIAI